MNSRRLQGCRILIVEDEYLLAIELADALAAEGADVLGPAGNIVQAKRYIDTADHIDGAVLDLNLRGEKAWPLIDALLSRVVPVVLTTGYDPSTIPPRFAHLPRLEKPVEASALIPVVVQHVRSSLA